MQKVFNECKYLMIRFVNIKNNYVKQIKDYSNLIKNSDFLFICVHLNNKTKDMVDKRWFKMMKKICASKFI